MYPHAVSHASTATDRESSRLRFTAWALLVWSLLYALPHLYWGLGGPEGHSVYKPSASQQAGWEAAHLFAFALITFAGLLGFALERTSGAQNRRKLLLVIVGAGCTIAGAHGLYGIGFRAAAVLGVTRVEGVPFDASQHGWVLWDLLAIEPWFLTEGVLLGMTGFFALSSSQSRRSFVAMVSAVFLVFFVTAALSLKVA